jgi:general stress protein 26
MGNHTAMDEQDVSEREGPGRRLDELIGGGHEIVMLMTMIDGEHRSRPLTCLEVVDDEVRFFVSRRTDWVQAIESGRAAVHLTFSDTDQNVYFAANGDPTIRHDDGLRRRLWSPAARVFFDGPDDPDLVVLAVAVTDGEYWEGPSSGMGRGLAMLRAMVKGEGSSSSSSLGVRGPLV